jgi:hypothetical protein
MRGQSRTNQEAEPHQLGGSLINSENAKAAVFLVFESH